MLRERLAGPLGVLSTAEKDRRVHALERDAERNQGQFVVVGSKLNLLHLFGLLELTTVLPVIDSIEAALHCLRRPVMTLRQDPSQLTHLRA